MLVKKGSWDTTKSYFKTPIGIYERASIKVHSASGEILRILGTGYDAPNGEFIPDNGLHINDVHIAVEQHYNITVLSCLEENISSVTQFPVNDVPINNNIEPVSVESEKTTTIDPFAPIPSI